MEAIKQIIRTPKNHEINIKIPEKIPENELLEIILILRRNQDYINKINELKDSSKDSLFMEDLDQVSRDFFHIDFENVII
jgi:hypothetical protein